MSIKGAEGVVVQMIATLQAHLGAELTLISSEMADGLDLPDVAAGDYFDWEKDLAYIENSPAITVNAESSEVIQITSLTNSPGQDQSIHRVSVCAHVKGANDDPSSLKKRLLRYARGIVRVLAIRYPTLPVAGVETAFMVKRDGAATYLDSGQEEGQYVRSAKIPFAVQTYETL